MTPEGKIKAKFAKWARSIGLRYINLIVTGSKGDPDKIILFPGGRPVFVEFKSERGRLSEHQKEKIEAYKNLGYPSVVISSDADLEKFKELIS